MKRQSSRAVINGTVACSICLAAAIAPAAFPRPAWSRDGQTRRLSVGIVQTSYIFDGSYWGIGAGFGADALLRCEVIRNSLCVESRLGGYGGSQDGTGISGLSGQIGIVHFLPVFIPNRPSFRAALALLTVNPIVSEPVETFRPSQTILYFVTGVGITWSLREHLQLECGVDLLISPYRYRSYRFYRQYVDTEENRFLHGAFTIGASYTF